MTSTVAENKRIVGDIIVIETTDDHTATAPTWTVVGSTTDSIEMSPNAEIADNREHGDFILQKDPVSEAWEISHAANMLTGPAQLQALGLLTEDNKERGTYDPGRDGNEAFRISVYADQAAYDAGDYKAQIGASNYVVAHDGGEINVDDYSTISIVWHLRQRPVRLGLGGTL
ncbi:hypothetical protein [Halococcus saccharolyticus]|uniref:Uncharacterized protein n=1 Tax=Halococcus saccharolyticus DSM 5350 TaxID=1227455 RepID=M0MBD2_9EURY|nr:hypothetical protein [Halococcus saccharolyticus]EMA42658.1 hypothetical protein C449_15988 [Halococcus saccharolyticus DSM 5350]